LFPKQIGQSEWEAESSWRCKGKARMEIKKSMTRLQGHRLANLKGFWFEGIKVNMARRIDLIFSAGSYIFYSLIFNNSINFNSLLLFIIKTLPF